MQEKSKINQMDSHEQHSLFSRLLETIIRHALKNKHEEDSHLTHQFISKSGSMFEGKEFIYRPFLSIRNSLRSD